MSFDREDFYNECKGYCTNIELIPILNDLIFDTDYGLQLNKEELIKLKKHLIQQIEATEKNRIGRILDNCGMIE